MSNFVDIPKNWQERSLISLAQYVNGFPFGPNDWAEEGKLIVRIEQLNNPSAKGNRFLGEVPSIYNIQQGDLIFSWSATLKAEFWKGEEGVLNQHLFKVIPKHDVCIELLHKILEFNMHSLASGSQGSTMKHITRAELIKYHVALPATISEQKKIAKILSTIDNLIEKTQALIDKYTSIKQGMMSDLFTRGIDLTAGPNYGKLRPNVEDAPEFYKETELGWVPNEWEVVALESIANVDRGKFTHRPRDDAKCYGGKHPFIQTGSVTKAKGGFITEYKQTLSDFGRSVSREFSAGTIAVTIAANIADTGILNIPMCFPDSIVGVNVDESKALIRYVEITIRRNKQRLDAIAPLSAQKNINLEDLRPLKVALPNMAEQIEICSRYESNEKLINKENANLEKIKLQKKGLMQDLLTGKVRVNKG